MIARAPYLFLLLIMVPDLYLDLHYWRHKFPLAKRIIYWLPSIILVAYTLKLTYELAIRTDINSQVCIYAVLHHRSMVE